MKIDIWSDIRCPFCYVGKKKFEKALAQFPEAENVEVTWHSFQLDPNLQTQPDRNPYEFFSELKNMSIEQAKAMHQHVQNAGNEAGITFNFDESKIANSFRAHLLIQLAKTKGKADDMEEELFKAQFIDGKNIDDKETLNEIGKRLAFSDEEIENALHSDELANEVAQDGLMARQLGITGVPFFIFNDKYGVSGAQQSEHFLEVLQKSYEEFAVGDKGLQIISRGDNCDIDGNC